MYSRSAILAHASFISSTTLGYFNRLLSPSGNLNDMPIVEMAQREMVHWGTMCWE
jgi:hypothetical protein